MTTLNISLMTIMLCLVVSPFLASRIPGRAVPEVVFLVFAGALLGPYGAHLIQPELPSLQFLSELGLGFLFLKAGFEIKPRELLGKSGKIAALSWLFSLLMGFGLAALLFSKQGFVTRLSWAALAITMTTTAFGTLAPILEERKLMNTSVGKAVIIHGAMGELLPIAAMSFILSSRSALATLSSFLFFGLIALIITGHFLRRKNTGSRYWNFLTQNSELASQPLMRQVILLLIVFLTLATVFDFDLVLGAFAAGFLLRALFPDGSAELEDKIRIISNSFFQPAFFVISGAGINLASAFNKPLLILGFIASLALVRGVSVAFAIHHDPAFVRLSWQQRFSAAAYCTMALPIVVAVTSVATDRGIMAEDLASTLVTAAALTVLIIPVFTSFVRVADEFKPRHLAHELGEHHKLRPAVHAHYQQFLELERLYKQRKREAIARGEVFSSATFFAQLEDEIKEANNEKN